MKTRLYKKQQNCNKLLTLFTMGVAMLTGVVAMGLLTIRESYHQARAFSYDDENYTITLSADELNNYTFDNLYSYISVNLESSNFTGTYFDSVYYNDTFIFSDFDAYGNFDLLYSLSNYQLIFNLNNDKKFVLIYSFDESSLSFVDFYSWVLNSDIYYGIQGAIEQDIAANQPPEPTQPMLDFISIIVSGLGAFASGVASGVSDFASALFLNVQNGQVVGLSVFGGILAIFAGLALAVAITTKVYIWITSLGN